LEPGDPALIVFTSGTAGEPKPVRHGQGYLAGQRVQAEHWYGAQAGDLCWCTAASGWSLSARNAFVAAWLRGATALLHDARFDPDERLELLERERVEVLCMSPTEYRAMAKRADLHPLPHLRHACAAGEPLNPEVVRVWQEEVGAAVHDGYGQTETGALTGMPIGPPVRPGSMGRPLPGWEVAILDEDERPLPPGERGEICLRARSNPHYPIGYWNRPEDTEEVFGGDWFHTKDAATVDEDGYVWYAGRADDVIISAGYRIGPFEVESACVEHPAVKEAAAVASPDPRRGDIVKAFIVLDGHHAASDELADEIKQFVREHLSAYAYPREIEFVADLPKTLTGKIRRVELREQERERK
ncbi:MAG: AMP-binding protein, partial [Thermoleophilia bacterium]